MLSLGVFQMRLDMNDAAIDEIVASCNGDVHGALKALLMVNEQLEDELRRLYAAVVREQATLH